MRNCAFAILLAAAMVAAGTSISGIAYSPFRFGQSPTGSSPMFAQIAEDITIIKNLSPKIRTFGIDKDYLRYIPKVCESLSVNYMIAGWCSFSYSNTWAQARTDIASFLKLADSLKYAHLDGVMYGYNNISESYSNYTEAEKTAKIIEELAALRKAIAAYKVKISHEENWDYATRHPELWDSLDFVSIRIMPQVDYIALSEANKYVRECYQAVKKVFPAKPVVITTVGWTTYNSCQRDQKIFLDSLVSDTSLSYYLHAFAEEVWKGNEEASYGIYSQYRIPKSFVNPWKAISFSNLFSRDTARLNGIIYDYSAFQYSSSISLPALQKNLGGWADTFAQISQYTIMNSAALARANGTILSIFGQHGNKIGLIYSGWPYYMLDSTKALDNCVKFVFIDGLDYSYFGSSYSGYGQKTDLERQTLFDNIRTSNYILRKNSKRDSLFVGLVVSNSYRDSVIKYPGMLEVFDGLLLTMSYSSLSSFAKREKSADSLLALIKTAVGSKPAVIQFDIYSFDTLGYVAIKKAADKHGIGLIFSHIGNFYNTGMVQPSVTYKYLLPNRFKSVILFPLAKEAQRALFVNQGSKIMISNAPKNAVFSLFNLKGERIKQIKISSSYFLFDLRAAGFSNGIWIAKVEAGDQVFSRKISFARQ